MRELVERGILSLFRLIFVLFCFRFVFYNTNPNENGMGRTRVIPIRVRQNLSNKMVNVSELQMGRNRVIFRKALTITLTRRG